MATIDESRKSEEEQRVKAEEARKAIDQLPRQVVEARMGDKHIQLCVEATEAALKDAKKKTEAAIKAEKKALEATKEVKDAEAKLKTEADKREAEALEAEAKLKTEADKLEAGAKATAEKPETEQNVEQLTVMSPPNPEEEAGAAETIASTKQDAANAATARAKADLAKATAEKPETDPTVAGLRQQEQESLAVSSQARVEEKLALEVLANARRQEEFFRSRFLPPKWWQPSQETLALLFSKELLIALFFLVLGLAGLSLITGSIFKPEFLDTLSNIDSARALVTYLVALSAVIIAMIITIYAVISTEDKEIFEKKFNHAKEVFTAFVGILGTIMGFYFATNDTGKTVPPLSVLSSDRSEAHPGEKVKFTSLMYKGKPPFEWEISSLPEGITGSGTDSDNYIEAQVPIPADLGEYDITLTVKDSEGNKVAEPKGKLTVIGSPDGIPPEFELTVDPKEVQAGKPITLKSKVSFDVGADYEISFDPSITLKDAKDKGKLASAGQFEETVDIPPETPAAEYTVILKVTDTTGKTVEEKGKLKINSQ